MFNHVNKKQKPDGQQGLLNVHRQPHVAQCDWKYKFISAKLEESDQFSN